MNELIVYFVLMSVKLKVMVMIKVSIRSISIRWILF